MALPRGSLGCFLSLAAFVAAASCGGSATNDPVPGPEDGGLPDVVTTDTNPGPPCAPPRKICGSACVDTSSDTKNCGDCGAACNGAELCVAAKCTLVTGFAARKVYLGETDRAGVASSTAWQNYGRNIDGITTVSPTDNGECKPVAGAPSTKFNDGPDGLDNSFGRNVLGFVLGLTPTPSKNTNDAIELGGRTPLLVFGDPLKPTVTSVPPFSLVTAENTLAPRWDGNDSRPIAESSTASGKPKTTFAMGTLTAGVLASGDASAPFVLSFVFGGAGTLDIPIRLARVTMTLAPDGKTATNGTLSGVVDEAEMETAFVKVAGAISAQLCDGSTLDTIRQTIKQAADILVDGTQDPTKTCNAISIGVGFDAALVAVGPVAGPVAPAPDPCKP